MKHVQGPAAGRAAAAPGDLGRARRGRRARDREGDREPLRQCAARWSTTSSRCSRSRPPRSGEASGEATTVLRSLPGDTADFAPVRLAAPRARWCSRCWRAARRRRRRAYFATRTEKGTGGAVVTGRAGPDRGASSAAGAASDYDPERRRRGVRRGHQQRDRRQPRDPSWETETYTGRLRGRADKSGVGLYVDAGAPVAARGARRS